MTQSFRLYYNVICHTRSIHAIELGKVVLTGRGLGSDCRSLI